MKSPLGHIWGNPVLDFTVMFLLMPLFPVLLLPLQPVAKMKIHWATFVMGTFTCFYGSLVAVSLLASWQIATIVYVVCFLTGFSMNLKCLDPLWNRLKPRRWQVP